MIDVAIAGSSGSIGTQTLEVVRADPERYRVRALAVSTAMSVVAQAREFRPEVVVVTDSEARRIVTDELPDMKVTGDLVDVVDVADVVVNGVVGFAGLPVTMATLQAGKRLALANKESLIAAAPVVNPLRSTPGAELVPVDSEHCAVHQCLRSSSDASRELRRLLITASGGPFRGRTAAELADVTVDEALAHPTWSMGPKITIDSSTLMNKGLEVIEAHALFGIGYDQIEVVVHPQSVVHSMAEYTDGSTIAQLGMPDMRLPISYALAYPERGVVPYGVIDWATIGSLDFTAPDIVTFRCLDLAYQAGRTGGTAPARLSAANEIAVEAFLAGRLRWSQIADVCDGALARHDGGSGSTLDEVIDADKSARADASELVQSLAS